MKKYAVMVTIEDDDGELARALVTDDGKGGVDISVQPRLGVTGLPLCGLLLTVAHACGEMDGFTEHLAETLLAAIQEVNSLMKVRNMAAKQKKPRRKAKASAEHTSQSQDNNVPF